MMKWAEGEKVTCELNDEQTHRYSLTCIWEDSRPIVSYIMLNPSTGNETCSDRTLRRCVNFARNWGYGGMIVVNLYSQITPHSEKLTPQTSEEKAKNYHYIKKAVDQSEQVIFAWGGKGHSDKRYVREVMGLVEDGKGFCIDRSTTSAGFPKHPLFLEMTDSPRPYSI